MNAMPPLSPVGNSGSIAAAFTDIVAPADGSLTIHKLLSENAGLFRCRGAWHAAVARSGARCANPAGVIDAVKMGTTVATNACSNERRAGARHHPRFADARIGYQNRPKLFVRRIELPALLYSRVIEVDGVGARGEEVRPLDLPPRGAISNRHVPRASTRSRLC
jgi:5-oxoprolinase (ATP-hydrolysing)